MPRPRRPAGSSKTSGPDRLAPGQRRRWEPDPVLRTCVLLGVAPMRWKRRLGPQMSVGTCRRCRYGPQGVQSGTHTKHHSFSSPFVTAARTGDRLRRATAHLARSLSSLGGRQTGKKGECRGSASERSVGRCHRRRRNDAAERVGGSAAPEARPIGRSAATNPRGSDRTG